MMVGMVPMDVGVRFARAMGMLMAVSMMMDWGVARSGIASEEE